MGAAAKIVDVETEDHIVLDDYTARHHQALEMRANACRDRRNGDVMKGGKAQIVEPIDGEVRLVSRRHRAHRIEAKDFRSTASSPVDDVFDGYGLRAAFGAVRVPGEMRLGEHVACIACGAAILAEADRHAGCAHFDHGCDAVTEPRIASGTMGDPSASICEDANILGIGLDQVGKPHILADPIMARRIFKRAKVVHVAAIDDVIAILGEMRMQSQTEPAHFTRELSQSVRLGG